MLNSGKSTFLYTCPPHSALGKMYLVTFPTSSSNIIVKTLILQYIPETFPAHVKLLDSSENESFKACQPHDGQDQLTDH